MAFLYFVGIFALMVACVLASLMSNNVPFISAILGFAFIIYDGLQEIKDAIKELNKIE